MDKTKTEIGLLNDYYGGLLTEYQSELVRLYYDCDLSLAEIGEEYGVSRQAVKNVLQRSVGKLTEYEDKLRLFSKLNALQERLRGLLNLEDRALLRQELEIIIKEVTEI